MSTDATIIVVENETDARVTMCRMLEDAGYKVIGLKRGIDALGIIGRSPFNAVITDIRLPDVGGLEILELAKEMNPDAAVIMMTSNASVETTVDAVDHGAYAYFVKPINPDELKTTIANALKQQRLSLENKRLIESLQHSRRLLSEANEELRNEITERKQAEEALKQSTERLHTLREEAPVIICIADLKGKVTYVNKKFEETTGYSREEVLGKNWLKFDVFHKKTIKLLLNRIREKLKGMSPSPMEIPFKRKDGEWIWISGIGELLREHSKPVGIQIIATDITERKQLEEALRENEEKLRLMFESAGEGIVVIDLDNKILDVNQVAVRMHGYDSREELIGRSALDLSAEEDRARASSNTRRRLEEGLRGAIEYTLLRKDGSKFPAEVNMATIRDAHGIPIGFIGIFVDITERKRIEKEIQEKNEELAEASRAKSEFLAHMSHELRTPLNVIIGFSELMMDELPGEVNEEQGQCLSDIWGSGQHLLSLINDILDLSKIESGKMELKLRNIALPSVIESLRREIMPVIGKRKQSLDVEVEEGLPLVRGDKVKVRQVLLNLLSNAAKFTPDGGKLKVEAIRNGDWCQVSVVDRGIGIKKEDQEKIFEPFSQLDDLQAEGKGGTGLGLTLARQIIEKHGGRMWVESKYRKGSKFSFTLPLATADEPHPRGRNRH